MLDTKRVFYSGRLLLRPMEKEDEKEFSLIVGESARWTWFTSDLSDPVELSAWVNEACLQMKAGNRLALTIVDKYNECILGSTSLGNHSEIDRRIEIGWTWLTSKSQGTGVNDKVKKLLLEYCFTELDLERVEFKTDVLNKYARKALERIGAREEGVLRSHTLMTGGRRRDTVYYSFLKNEWISANDK